MVVAVGRTSPKAESRRGRSRRVLRGGCRARIALRGRYTYATVFGRRANIRPIPAPPLARRRGEFVGIRKRSNPRTRRGLHSDIMSYDLSHHYRTGARWSRGDVMHGPVSTSLDGRVQDRVIYSHFVRKAIGLTTTRRRSSLLCANVLVVRRLLPTTYYGVLCRNNEMRCDGAERRLGGYASSRDLRCA